MRHVRREITRTLRIVRVARVIKQPTQPQQASPPVDLLADFLGPEKKSKSKSANQAGSRRRAHIADVAQRVESKDWNDAGPRHLVALYWFCHTKVYGTEPKELDTAAAWTRAMMFAGKLVREEFEGDVQLAIRFMRWTWNREKEREAWRRQNRRSGGRITWQQQFVHRYLVSDWRTDKTRHMERAG